jgi:hypothetical protein
MSDRFDERANGVALAMLSAISPREGVGAAESYGAIVAAVAAALRSTDGEAERRGELKCLEWCLESYETCSYGAASRYNAVLKARIAELKKGEKL